MYKVYTYLLLQAEPICWSLSAHRFPTDGKLAVVPTGVELPLGWLLSDIQQKSEKMPPRNT